MVHHGDRDGRDTLGTLECREHHGCHGNSPAAPRSPESRGSHGPHPEIHDGRGCTCTHDPNSRHDVENHDHGLGSCSCWGSLYSRGPHLCAPRVDEAHGIPSRSDGGRNVASTSPSLEPSVWPLTRGMPAGRR
eukprot:4502834-Pyramimonas_sp.AAC.1